MRTLILLMWSALTLCASNVPGNYVLDTGNALTTSLAAAWLITEGSGTTTVDKVNSITCTLAGNSPPTWTTDATYGTVLSFTGGGTANSYLTCGTPAPLQDIGASTNGYAATFAFLVNNTNSSNWGLIDRSDSNSVNAGYWLGTSGGTGIGTGYLDFVKERASTNGWYAVAKPAPSAWHLVVVTYTGDGVSTGTTIYVDGVAQSSVLTPSDGSGTAGSDATRTLYLGRTTVTGTHETASSFTGQWALAYIWRGRVLTAAEVSSLSSDPYQLFKAPAAPPVSAARRRASVQ